MWFPGQRNCHRCPFPVIACLFACRWSLEPSFLHVESPVSPCNFLRCVYVYLMTIYAIAIVCYCLQLLLVRWFAGAPTLANGSASGLFLFLVPGKLSQQASWQVPPFIKQFFSKKRKLGPLQQECASVRVWTEQFLQGRFCEGAFRYFYVFWPKI